MFSPSSDQLPPPHHHHRNPPLRPHTAAAVADDRHLDLNDMYQNEVWDEDELPDQDDEDEGMFSFAPPPENSLNSTDLPPALSNGFHSPIHHPHPSHLQQQHQQQQQQHYHHPHHHHLPSPSPSHPPLSPSPTTTASQPVSPPPIHHHPSLAWPHADQPLLRPHSLLSPPSPAPTSQLPPPPPPFSHQYSNHHHHHHHHHTLSPAHSPSPPSIPPISYPPSITPAAAIVAQYHRHPDPLVSPHNSNQTPHLRALGAASFPSKNASSPNDEPPVIELRPGLTAASWRAAHRDLDDRESVKSGSTHSLHKLSYYQPSSQPVPPDSHHTTDQKDASHASHHRRSNSVGMMELRSKSPGSVTVSQRNSELWNGINSGRSEPLARSLSYQPHGQAAPDTGTNGPTFGLKRYSDSQSQLTNHLDGFNMDDYDVDEEDSPYPEVRASVSNIDDPEMPCLTFRAWVLGLLFVVVCGALNMFFQLRYPAPYIYPVIVQILSYPAGKLCATMLPDKVHRLPGGTGQKRPGFKGFLDRVWPSWLGAGAEWSLNPGPFNIKEHTIIAVMANAAVGPVYAVNMTLVMEKYYHHPPGPGFDFGIAIATQLLGFSLAGVTRRFLVWPASMIWPSNLVVCTLLNTFHAEDDDGSDGSLTRFRFFMYVAGGAFVWYWFPGYLFTALSTFSWVCWLAPRNRLLNQMFGSVNGLGLSILTFDWSQIAYIGSPLVVPWWAEVNVILGFVLFFYIFAPALYYTNTWSLAYLPLGSAGVFDRYGNPYNTSKVVNLENDALNLTAYREYSPLFLPATFVAVYAVAFALATSAIVHTVLYHGHSIWDKIKNIKTEDEDVHAKLMRNYPEVPDWWYWSYFLGFTGVSVFLIEIFDTGLPIWGLFLALFVALVYILPGGFIFAMTSQQITINLVAEIIPGYLLPGKPFSNMLFKTFSVQSLLVGLAFIQDLKLGHYMKIPPRSTFMVQIVAAFLSAFVQTYVKKFLVSTVPDLCDKHQANLLTCPNASVFYSASILWGLLGPQKQFGEGTQYRPIVYFALVGALLPIPLYLMTKRWPNSWLKYANLPVLLLGACWIPPATAINYTSWISVGFVFQYLLRRTKFRWWSKYNFVLSAGLDVGTVVSAIVIFFTVQLPKNAASGSLSWWGNTVYTNTDDFNGTPYYDPPPGGFGPSTW